MDYENVDSIEHTSKSTDRCTFGWTQNFVRLLFFMRHMFCGTASYRGKKCSVNFPSAFIKPYLADIVGTGVETGWLSQCKQIKYNKFFKLKMLT